MGPITTYLPQPRTNACARACVHMNWSWTVQITQISRKVTDRHSTLGSCPRVMEIAIKKADSRPRVRKIAIKKADSRPSLLGKSRCRWIRVRVRVGVGVRIKLELCLKISPPLHAKRTAHAKRCMESRIHELCGYPPHHCTNHPQIPFSGAVNTSIYTVGISPTAVLIAHERCLVGPLTRVYIRQFEGFQHTIYILIWMRALFFN